MGKGDKKTKKGKISMGSYGVRRPHKISVEPPAPKKKTKKKK
ncbi:MAG: 30S ribosomal protein THX [Reichenbachiella sp.]